MAPSSPFFHTILISLIFCTFSTLLLAFPPPNPVECDHNGCILYNSYKKWNDDIKCRARTVFYPVTEEDLLLAVADAARKKIKVKVVTRYSHSLPKLACPAGGTSIENGLNSTSSAVMISTEKYNSHIDVDVANRVVTVDAGVGLRELIDKVDEHGLSLVVSPYWEGVTVGGVISTGAHGSSWWGKGGAVHDHVVGVRLIVPATKEEGYAKVVNLKKDDPLLNAAKVSLGLLGVISKVTISLEAAFKRRITYNFTTDEKIEEEFMDHAKLHEFGDIQWYPSQNIAVYRYDGRVPLDTTGDGTNDFIGFQSIPIVISQDARSTEKTAEEKRDVKAKCAQASSFVDYKKLLANGLINNLSFDGYPVIGRQSKMQSSGSCLHSSSASTDGACPWDRRINGLFYFDSAAIFTASNFRDFIRDVKILRDKIKPEHFCGVDIYNGVLIRFIKGSNAFLGQAQDSVVVDFTYFRGDDGFTPRLNQDVWEEVEQMAFIKYSAKPHWAKNRNVAFIDVKKKYVNFDKFMAAKKMLDPLDLFSSEWLDENVFGKKVGDGRYEKADGCALEGNCICSEDRHCSPSHGYLCQSGVVFKDARVCGLSPTPSA